MGPIFRHAATTPAARHHVVKQSGPRPHAPPGLENPRSPTLPNPTLPGRTPRPKPPLTTRLPPSADPPGRCGARRGGSSGADQGGLRRVVSSCTRRCSRTDSRDAAVRPNMIGIVRRAGARTETRGARRRVRPRHLTALLHDLGLEAFRDRSLLAWSTTPGEPTSRRGFDRARMGGAARRGRHSAACWPTTDDPHFARRTARAPLTNRYASWRPEAVARLVLRHRRTRSRSASTTRPRPQLAGRTACRSARRRRARDGRPPAPRSGERTRFLDAHILLRRP